MSGEAGGGLYYPDSAEEEDDGRCIHCGAELGHYNGCLEDPESMCLCHLCMGDQAVTSEERCPFHGAAV